MTDCEQPRATRGVIVVQSLLGLGAELVLALPYLRRAHGLEKLDPQRRYLFACNHVSLLDTILLGALCWRSRCYPILVLGDKKVWHATWLHKILSRPIGFLLERGRLNPNRVGVLETFGRAGAEYHLVVFPEGTRGDGVNVSECQPGIFYIAQQARLPLVPVFFENMQLVSTKTGRFHPIAGLRKVEVHFGDPIPPENYLAMTREEFTAFVQRRIAAAQTSRTAAHSSPAPLRG